MHLSLRDRLTLREGQSVHDMVSHMHSHLLKPILFVVAAYLPSKKSCHQLRHTLESIHNFHPTDQILVVDNGSPENNVQAVAPFGRNVHLSTRQNQSQGQLGSWLVAYKFLSTGGLSIHFERVVCLQHSTSLRATLPPLPPGCETATLSPQYPRNFALLPRELQNRSANARLSLVAAALGIRCLDPCLDIQGKPIKDRGAMAWMMNSHSVMDLSRRAFNKVGAALSPGGGPAATVLREQVWSALEKGDITLKELNGQLERFSGVLLRWLNGPPYMHCGHQPWTNVAKVHGGTFGGGWAPTLPGRGPRPPREEQCRKKK